jgi:membrane protease YdiL (CAAX protease family)
MAHESNSATTRPLVEALIAYMAFCGLSVVSRFIPPLLGLQLAIGIPLAFLILSPFQEFFFQGWLQPRFEASLGWWMGLLVTALGFALWHVRSPLEGSPTSTLAFTSIESILTALGMGLLFGYIFDRAGNIVAPWLAHALWIVGLIPVGALTVVQYSS